MTRAHFEPQLRNRQRLADLVLPSDATRFFAPALRIGEAREALATASAAKFRTRVIGLYWRYSNE